MALEGLKRSIERGAVVDDRVPKVNWGLVLTVVALLVGWLLMGFSDNRAIISRITALETNRANDAQRMERIESKVDRVLELVK